MIRVYAPTTAATIRSIVTGNDANVGFWGLDHPDAYVPRLVSSSQRACGMHMAVGTLETIGHDLQGIDLPALCREVKVLTSVTL